MRQGILRRCMLSVFAATMAVDAYAVANGFYVGLMMGPATNNASQQMVQVTPTDEECETITEPKLTTANPRSNQFGVRAFMGNQFSQYAAFELGLWFISKIKYQTTDDQEPCTDASERVRSVDLSLKGIMPFGEYIDIFGKIGASGTYRTTSGALNPEFDLSSLSTKMPPPTPEERCSAAKDQCGKNENSFKFSPLFAVGASYTLTQNWVVDLSYTSLQVGGNVGSVGMLALGASYHAVDIYCGQFLC